MIRLHMNAPDEAFLKCEATDDEVRLHLADLLVQFVHDGGNGGAQNSQTCGCDMQAIPVEELDEMWNGGVSGGEASQEASAISSEELEKMWNEV
jgi:hypothetical protein